MANRPLVSLPAEPPGRSLYPVQSPAPRSNDAPAASPPGPRLTPAPRALIVDDDLGFQAGLAELVKREGFTVQSANTLKEARAEIAARPPDILLGDLHLP